MCSTDTRTTVLDGPVRARELSKVMASHLRLDFHRVENLAVVDADDTADHFWDDNHVPEVSLDDCRLLIRGSLLFGLAQLFDETHWAALKTTVELAACACVDEVNELFVVHVKELVELNTTVRERAEGSLLLDLSGESGVSNR